MHLLERDVMLDDADARSVEDATVSLLRALCRETGIRPSDLLVAFFTVPRDVDPEIVVAAARRTFEAMQPRTRVARMAGRIASICLGPVGAVALARATGWPAEVLIDVASATHPGTPRITVTALARTSPTVAG